MARELRCVLALFVSVGCASSPHSAPSHSAISEREGQCARAPMGVFGPYRMPLAEEVTVPEDAAVLAVLPEEARRTARAAGLEPLLVKLIRARARLTPESDERVLELQQELTLRLLAFDAQVSALGFEVECTRRRVADLANELDGEEAVRQFTLAASSLVIGASTGIFADASDLAGSTSDVPAIIGLTGSLVTAGLGVAVFVVPDRAIELRHPQNLLRPIAEGSDPDHLYSTFVFRMLAAPDAAGAPAPRESLLAAFDDGLHHYVGSSQRKAAREIMFGAGGRYSRALLESRRENFQWLQSAIQGVARNLELLNRFLVRLLTSKRGDSVILGT